MRFAHFTLAPASSFSVCEEQTSPLSPHLRSHSIDAGALAWQATDFPHWK